MEDVNVTGQAPDLSEGYPSTWKRKLGPCWQQLWDTMSASPGEFLDGRELADEVAHQHRLAPSTVVAFLSRAAKAGLLDREPRQVMSGRGYRTRTFYRIADRSE